MQGGSTWYVGDGGNIISEKAGTTSAVGDTETRPVNIAVPVILYLGLSD